MVVFRKYTGIKISSPLTFFLVLLNIIACMETKHKYITLVKDHSDFASEIVEFCSPRYKHPFTEKTVANTAITCLVKGEDNEIIGAVRAISDLSRHGQIVDLIVDEEHRKKNWD